MILWSRKESLRKEPNENSERLSTEAKESIQGTKEENILRRIEIRSRKRKDITGMCQTLIIITPQISFYTLLSKKNGTRSLVGYVDRMGILPQDARKGKNQSLTEGRRLLSMLKKPNKSKKSIEALLFALNVDLQLMSLKGAPISQSEIQQNSTG